MSATTMGRVLLPVWLRVPAHADVGVLSDDDVLAECRRRGYAVWPLGRDLELPGLVVRADRPALTWRGREVTLSPREAEVVKVLAGAWPRAVPPWALQDAVWGAHTSANLQRVYVGYVRAKAPGLIETLGQGRGYRLALAEEGA